MDEKETTSGAEDPLTKTREAEVLITKARGLLLEVLQKSDVEISAKPGGGGGVTQNGCGHGCSCPKPT